MGLFEELAARFPVGDFPPLGGCLIIPAGEFKPGWEETLRAEGCRVFAQAYNGRACFIVWRPPAKPKAQSQAEGVEKPKHEADKPARWLPNLLHGLRRLGRRSRITSSGLRN